MYVSIMSLYFYPARHIWSERESVQKFPVFLRRLADYGDKTHEEKKRTQFL